MATPIGESASAWRSAAQLSADPLGSGAMQLANTATGFLFCVFAASDPASAPAAEPVYLRQRAEAHFLEGLLAHLYESDRIGITTSDDEIIPPASIPIVEMAIRSAIAQVQAQPETWPILLGYRSEALDHPIIEQASRQVLLEFLDAVLVETQLAKRRGHHLVWGGGE